jgi:hypothetical protein
MLSFSGWIDTNAQKYLFSYIGVSRLAHICDEQGNGIGRSLLSIPTRQICITVYMCLGKGWSGLEDLLAPRAVTSCRA